MYFFGETHDQYSAIFGCQGGEFPFKYLGITMHYRKLSNKDWKKVEERIEKRLSSWIGKYLSVGGRLFLINSVLTSLVIFMMSFFLKSWEEFLKK
jgi:predicted PurR-regulated permease PerM